MPIRIRVYPQPHSIGARRNRARRRQQQLIRQSFNWQQQLLRQQMQQRVFGFGGFGGAGLGGYGGAGVGSYGSTVGYSPSQWSAPGASGWGFAAGAYPAAYGSPGSSYAGAYSVPGHGSSYSSGFSGGFAPASVAQYAGTGRAWYGC